MQKGEQSLSFISRGLIYQEPDHTTMFGDVHDPSSHED